MGTIALIAVGLLAFLLFALFGALLEMYRDVRQLREAAGILDRPLAVDITSLANTAPTAYGLPAAMDSEERALLLFLTERCLTCRILANALESGIPAGLWVLVEARNAEYAERYMRLGQDSADRVIWDIGGDTAARLGIDASPVGLRIESGRFTSATTVPSTRYLSSILPTPLHLQPKSQGEQHGKRTRAF